MLTSNRTRDVHDALKRRCLYHWVEHPDFDREVAIVRLRAPEVGEPLARQVAAAVEALRDLSLYKPPGVAETIDWATALGRLGVTQLDEQAVAATLGTVLKYREDHERVEQHGFADIVKQAFERAHRARLTRGDRRRTGRTDGAERWPSPSPGCCAAPASPCRRARCSPSPRRSAPSASTDRDDVYWAGRATLVRRPEDIDVFDRAFRVFWDHAEPAGDEAEEPEPVTDHARRRQRRRRRRRPASRRGQRRPDDRAALQR